MIPVSDAWKEAQKGTLLPETFVEVTYTITEPGVQERATATANYSESFSNVAQIVGIEDRDSEAYATLDYGAWGLNGGYSYFNGSPINPGYVDTHYSEADCSVNVSPYPTITITLPEQHNVLIPGVTITWSKAFGSWASSFRVTARDEEYSIIAQKTVTDNTDVTTRVWLDLIYYSEITIEVLKWSHPFQRIRCSDIRLGIGVVYTKTDLLGFEHRQSVDLLSAVLPQSNITFKLRTDDDRWNPDNPTGAEKYLLEQQEIKVRYGMDIDGITEWIKGGTFWLSEWDTPNNGLEANFTARDAIGFMGGKYTGPRSGSLYTIAEAALIEADLPMLGNGNARYVLDSSLKTVLTNFTENTQEFTIGEILQMVAHAGCCVFYQDRDGVVHIEPMSDNYSEYVIEPRICYTHPEYTINKPLKTLSVSYGEDSRLDINVGTKGEIQTVDNPLIVTESNALVVGRKTESVLENRKVISGDFRADLRLDALDNIVVRSKYASNVVRVTDVNYSTTSGAFKGTYTGRVVSTEMVPSAEGDLT